jgi:large subunit ribosomal protein L3
MAVDKKFSEGLLGKKLGMTHVYAEDGACIPVTVVQVGPCYVLGMRDSAEHGYSAVQLGFEPKMAKRVNKPEQGHFNKAEKGAFYHVKEIRCDTQSLGWNEVGKELRVGDVFQDGEFIDVTGTSIGRGFAGVVKRYHMKGQPATRGTHEDRRNIGSVGCRKSPGRIHKGKRMSGHMGAERVTVQNLKVIGVRAEDNLLLIHGGIPGSKGSLVLVRKSIKKGTASKAA